MAQYILIEFDNDAQADSLRERIDNAERSGKSFRIVGVFKRPPPPDRRCQCHHNYSGSMTRAPEEVRPRRHKKFGFWYCFKCKKVKGGPQSPRNLVDPRDGKRFAPFLSCSTDGLPTANYPLTEGY